MIHSHVSLQRVSSSAPRVKSVHIPAICSGRWRHTRAHVHTHACTHTCMCAHTLWESCFCAVLMPWGPSAASAALPHGSQLHCNPQPPLDITQGGRSLSTCYKPLLAMFWYIVSAIPFLCVTCFLLSPQSLSALLKFLLCETK